MATRYATVSLVQVASTQDEAKQRAQGGATVLVVAARQVDGRGRSGRIWWEAPRAMYSSLAFRPHWPTDAWPRLTLMAGLAVRGALGALTETTPALKWPNDLVTAGGKVGGILTEAEGDLVIVGCGVNLWWPEPPQGVVAACEVDPGPALATAVAEAWADALLMAATAPPDRWGVDAYRSACATLGQDVTWDPDGAGRAVAIDDDGRLVVEAGGRRIALDAGEVRAVRGATVAPEAEEDQGGSAP